MKTVLITGITRGIGKAMAEVFSKNDWEVIGTSTDGRDNTIKLDLSNPKSIEQAVLSIKEKHLQIDVLINNAGVSFESDENKMNIESLRKTLEINLIGTVDFTEKILANIATGGQIISISSMMSSLVEFDNGICPSYRISKTALNMYSKTLADRLTNITVSVFDPGWVKTDMGGPSAPRDPGEPAQELFKLATTSHQSGQFWFEGKIRSW